MTSHLTATATLFAAIVSLAATLSMTIVSNADAHARPAASAAAAAPTIVLERVVITGHRIPADH